MIHTNSKWIPDISPFIKILVRKNFSSVNVITFLQRIELKEALVAKVKAPATPPTSEGSIEAEKLQQENQQLQERILKVST